MSYSFHTQTDISPDTPLGIGALTFASVTQLLAQLAEWLSAERLYRVRILYTVGSSTWQNTLFYWASSFGADWLADAESIAFQVRQEIVPKLLPVVPAIVNISEIRVTGFSKFFDQISDEYVEYVNQPGSAGNQDSWKSGRPAFLLRFFLNPGGFVQSLGQALRLLPRRGRVFVPAAMSDVAAGESVSEGFFGASGPLRALSAKLSQPLENLDPPVVYRPIRVKFWRVPLIGRFIATGYLPVVNVTPSPEVSFLDKRQF